ncbi:hypothetical protein BDF20DRAFT_917436 [Mycotypha africana]|uniref:uncharacterized protein n=1 Tax=Mycotypha africana TaxID=64632 RepID=UPI0023014E5A|nr:uncharacterized protein BDF20DRAFT_917436 [Mycotypha africana]KAI8967484.1 hypothetical protein BDF20DRAFT_917436 [Mycotypha africana]
MSSSPTQNSLFRQQQHLYRSAHFLAKSSKQPTLYVPPSSNDGLNKGRKRRASYEDEEMTNSDNADCSYRSPPQQQHQQHSTTVHSYRDDYYGSYHASKRNRMSIKKDFPISKLLATLDKDKLIDLINDLVDSNPHLKSEIDAHIPPPTTQSISLIIGNLEKKLMDSFPYNKSTARDDYTFNRVKTAILDIVNTLLEYADHFTSPISDNNNSNSSNSSGRVVHADRNTNSSSSSSGNHHSNASITVPDQLGEHHHSITIFSYLHYATDVANRLPVWDTDAHNQIKQDLFTELIGYWKKAINIAASKVSQGKIFGQQVVTEWAKDIVQHDQETQGRFGEVIQLFTERLGWIIGVDNVNTLSSIASRTNLW